MPWAKPRASGDTKYMHKQKHSRLQRQDGLGQEIPFFFLLFLNFMSSVYLNAEIKNSRVAKSNLGSTWGCYLASKVQHCL